MILTRDWQLRFSPATLERGRRASLFLIALAFSVPASAEPGKLVHVPPFHAVHVQGGAELMVVPGAAQTVMILAGNTQRTSFRVAHDGTLDIEACNENCPRSHVLRVRIESPRMPDITAEFGATVTAGPGFPLQRQLSASVYAGGAADLHLVEADNISVAVDSGGQIHVWPRLTLSGAVKNGGEVYFAGHPHLSTMITDGGDVEQDR